ncbi:MAG: DUF2110 family protein [Halobacteriales archaeon]|nr:DUF2110 family protein [Halobacteriales archaeon]
MVVLGTKIYVEGDARERALDSLRSIVADRIGELAVEYTVGLRHDGFPSVTVEGADAVAARNLLAEEWGTIRPDLDADAIHVGTLESWDADGFTLDAGQPVELPTEGLGLGPGDPAQIRDRFGLVQHLPLRFTFGDDEGLRLTDAQRDRLYDWTRGAGRVNVNSATRSEVRATVNRAGHAQDIVSVERLGLLEQSIVCAEGTDPPGLLADIGPHLPSELKCVIP